MEGRAKCSLLRIRALDINPLPEQIRIQKGSRQGTSPSPVSEQWLRTDGQKCQWNCHPGPGALVKIRSSVPAGCPRVVPCQPLFHYDRRAVVHFRGRKPASPSLGCDSTVPWGNELLAETMGHWAMGGQCDMLCVSSRRVLQISPVTTVFRECR